MLFSDVSIGAVVVATRHDSHARFVLEALRAGKHVFVEKPLALRLEELGEIETEWTARPYVLLAGFNRRFAPQATKMRQLLATLSAPKSVVITVNAGAVAADHWTRDEKLSGGRLIGEGCHFLDLARFLVGRPIVAARWHKSAERDTANLRMEFDDGSQATVHYFANGHRECSKERVEVFAEGRVLALDNWRKLRGLRLEGVFQAESLATRQRQRRLPGGVAAGDREGRAAAHSVCGVDGSEPLGAARGYRTKDATAKWPSSALLGYRASSQAEFRFGATCGVRGRTWPA